MTLDIPPASRQDLLLIVTTEHTTLQGARAAAISDANGRTGFFLATLSAVVVALAFVAQVSELGEAFVVFASVLLPILLFVGLAIFERLLQLAMENIRCVVAINRLRHYYLEIAPELMAHLTLSPYDDTTGLLVSLGSTRQRVRPWDLVISNAGLVATIDSIIAAVISGLAIWQLGGDLVAAAIGAAIVGVVALTLLFWYLVRTLRAAQRAVGVRFPTSAGIEATHDRRPTQTEPPAQNELSPP
ncbi:MAG: hypothetical protein H0V36_11290 [Chloroflexi bacterium]|nr:hypothetical protein [Chloroflexota bacterium]